MLPNSQVKAAGPAVKISSGFSTHTNGNGNGADALSGRGLAHRKWTAEERIAYAADVAMGVTRLDLSFSQLCTVFHITPSALRAAIKARNGNEHAGTLAAAKTYLHEFVDEMGLNTTMDLLSQIEAERCEVLDVE
jgi:hypothetical protein